MDQQATIALFALAIGVPTFLTLPLLMHLVKALSDIDRRLSRLEKNGYR